ncbi:hypothetical protein ANCCEY_12917 [Ancylostoma ceylanicum]|uniref:Uncharacterized protein n=1 Tax=Ancylostoma ceylanicum TaxID=53326 RepID=A0A0D6L8N5_9BILA|nr:hypothetical protein ANCCEY_12917 [Ancylostoma ceylanicum]
MVPNKETQIFREYWDPRFPDIIDLIKKCPMDGAQQGDTNLQRVLGPTIPRYHRSHKEVPYGVDGNAWSLQKSSLPKKDNISLFQLSWRTPIV